MWIVTLLLVVGVHCSTSAAGQHFGVLGQFQRLTASSALLLPSINVSSACLQQTHLVMQEADRLNIWALKILDATAKVPSGILNGNMNQFGDFDLCLEDVGNTGGEPIRGRYCLADFDIVPKDQRFKEIDERAHAYRMLTSEVDDHPQRLPKLSTWRWGVCIPSACSAQDLNVHLHEYLSQSLGHVAHVNVHVDPDACYTAEKPSLTFGHYVTILLFLAMFACISLGTIQETMISKPQQTPLGRFLQCFSVQRNWRKLVSTEPEGEEVEVVNGSRGMNSLALLMGHKQMAYIFTPFINATAMTANSNAKWTMIARSLYLYTDSFIMLSGLLVAHSTIKTLDRTGKVDFLRNLITRYIRFTPNLLFLILANTYLVEFFGSGPLWGLVVEKYSSLCKNHMWRNLLYIHNYYPWESMCLTNTHQLGIDMQLFVFSPILLYLLWKTPRLGVLATVTVAAISSWLRYTVAVDKEINYVVNYGASIQKMFNTATFSYSVPTHRATVYCFGLLLGYALRRGYTRINMSRPTAAIGWCVATAAALYAVFGQADMGQRGYVYDPYQAAFNNTLAPILWCIFMVWTGIACWNDKGGWVNTLLTWKYFRVFSRISYAFYLVQFPIFFYTVGTVRGSQSFNRFALIDLKETIVVFAAAILLTIAVDMPCQNLRRIYFSSSKKSMVEDVHDKNANITRSKKALKTS